MEQFEEVEVVKALKKHLETIKELKDQQYKASQALDILFKYKTNKLNVNTTRDIDDFTGKTLGIPFLSEQLINSLGDVLQNNKETIEKQLEIYVKKLDMDLSTPSFASKEDQDYKKLQEEHEKLKHMYKTDVNHQSELIKNATRERDSAKEYATSLESKLYSLRKDKENLEKVLNKYKNGSEL